jgi:AraC family transcriptional activator FtrA
MLVSGPRADYRRFRAAMGESPATQLLAAQLTRAKELLERTSLGMEAVAAESGLGSAATLRAHFRTRMGMAPAAWRARFAGPGRIAAAAAD